MFYPHSLQEKIENPIKSSHGVVVLIPFVEFFSQSLIVVFYQIARLSGRMEKKPELVCLL